MALSTLLAHKARRVARRGATRPMLLLCAKSAQDSLYSVYARNLRGIPALSHGDVAESEQIGADGLPLGNACKLPLGGCPPLRRKLDSLLLEVPIGNGRQDAREGRCGPPAMARRIGRADTVVRQVKPLRPMLEGDLAVKKDALQDKLGKVTLTLQGCVTHGVYLMVKRVLPTGETCPVQPRRQGIVTTFLGGFPEARAGGTIMPIAGIATIVRARFCRILRQRHHSGAKRPPREGSRAFALNRA